MSNAVVIGAGPGGLAAAILLQGRGVQVDLFEAASRPGGRAAGVTRDGFVLESGPVFFHGKWVLEKLLERVGRRLGDLVPLRRVPHPGFRCRFDDGRAIDLTHDVDSLADQLDAVEAGAGSQLRGFLEDAARKLDPGMEMFMTRPSTHLLQFAFGRHMKHLWPHRPWTTLDQELRRRFRSPDIRSVLSVCCCYLGAPPSRISSAMSVVPAMEISEGIFYPDGGFPALMGSLQGLLEDLGGRVHLSAPVERIVTRGGRAAGVVAAGQEHPADAVVVNADLAHACRALLAPEDRPHLSDGLLDRMRYSASVYVLSLGLAGTPPVDAPYTLHMQPPGIIEEFHDRPELALRHDRPMMMQAVPSALTASVAPPGSASVQLSAIVPNLDHAVPWSEERHRWRGTLLRRFREQSGGDLPRVVTEVEITPEVWRSRYRVDRGAVFSFAHDTRQVGPYRPANRSPRLPGLVWVGGGTHPGSGIFPILLSAVIADDLCHDEGLGPPPAPWPLGARGRGAPSRAASRARGRSRGGASQCR